MCNQKSLRILLYFGYLLQPFVKIWWHKANFYENLLYVSKSYFSGKKSENLPLKKLKHWLPWPYFSFLLRMGKEALLLKHFACFHISKKDWEFFPTLSISSSLSCDTYKLMQTMGFSICFCCTWFMHSLLAPACMEGFGSIFWGMFTRFS